MSLIKLIQIQRLSRNNKQNNKSMSQPLKKVGPYKLWRCIGSGATSQVFQATKEGEHQKYAIKMIRLGKITENQKSMIIKQISIIKSILHKHIVKLHDNLETTNNFYLVFEFCEKGDLEKYLKKYYGPLIPEDAVQKIIFCIGDAMREIHTKGIVHRDIKLANILLKKQMNTLVIKLADFGFAKEINQQEFMLKTYCGTPITMAPQILQNQYYDKKCDIWSLGIIMFQLVYGKLPFAINQGYNKFVQRVVKQPLKIPSQPQMPQQFKQLLSKCLQKKPQKRYSIEQFMSSEWILQGKDKKLDEQKQQVQAQLTKIVKQISNNQIQKQAQLQERQRNQIIEMNTAQKLYRLLKNEIQKIVENHVDTREELYERIQKALSSQEIEPVAISEYKRLLRLLEFLDLKYLNFLKELKITITKDTADIPIKLSDINNLELPTYLYLHKISNSETKPPQPMAIGQTITQFLQTLSQTQTDTLQKRRQRYYLIQRFLSLLRRYELTVQITFAHHYHRQQISLQNVFTQFKQMGKHVSESTIQESGEMIENGNQNQDRQIQLMDEKGLKYDKLSNFITLSLECKEKDQKLKEYRDGLKVICDRAIDQISKAIQGYYN